MMKWEQASTYTVIKENLVVIPYIIHIYIKRQHCCAATAPSQLSLGNKLLLHYILTLNHNFFSANFWSTLFFNYSVYHLTWCYDQGCFAQQWVCKQLTL